MADINGIRYYKRKAEYDGDVTLNRSLLGEEIDGNFFFLRGYDIEKLGVDKDDHLLTLERVNGDKLTVDISQEIGDTLLTFDPETGILHVKTPASEYDVEGFLSVDTPIHVASDETLKGDGSIESPLGISDAQKTGMLAPADIFVDITSGGSIPEDPTFGYRVVSKETIDNFGLLYSYAGVEKIAEHLRDISSEWRVPTREDWASMLDSIEDDPCEESMHDTLESGVYLGEVAGKKLKSTTLWDESSTPGSDEFDFGVLPLGYIDANGSEIEDAVKKNASFWTTSEESLREEIYIKGFDFNTNKVYQGTWDQRAMASVRLVKDDDGANFFENEIIDGETIPCVQMPNHTIWTAKNIGFSSDEFSGKTSQKWSTLPSVEEVAFYINTYDGKQWTKRRITDGETIVIRDNEGTRYGIWKIVGDEIIVLGEATGLDEEINNRKAADEELAAAISAETAARIMLSEDVSEISELVNGLLETVSALTQRVGVLEEQLANVTAALDGATANSFTKNVMQVLDNRLLGYPRNISVVKVDDNDNITNVLDNAVAFRIKFAPDVIFLADTNYENNEGE